MVTSTSGRQYLSFVEELDRYPNRTSHRATSVRTLKIRGDNWMVIPFLVTGMAALVLAAEQGLGIRIPNTLCSPFSKQIL